MAPSACDSVEVMPAETSHPELPEITTSEAGASDDSTPPISSLSSLSSQIAEMRESMAEISASFRGLLKDSDAFLKGLKATSSHKLREGAPEPELQQQSREGSPSQSPHSANDRSDMAQDLSTSKDVISSMQAIFNNQEMPDSMQATLSSAIQEAFAIAIRQTVAEKMQAMITGIAQSVKGKVSETGKALSTNGRRLKSEVQATALHDAVLQATFENGDDVSDAVQSTRRGDDDASESDPESISAMMQTLDDAMSKLMEALWSFEMPPEDVRYENRQISCDCPDCTFIDPAHRSYRSFI